MADRYLLESGAPDGYLLEDGSGVLLLEVPPPPPQRLEFWRPLLPAAMLAMGLLDVGNVPAVNHQTLHALRSPPANTSGHFLLQSQQPTFVSAQQDAQRVNHTLLHRYRVGYQTVGQPNLYKFRPAKAGQDVEADALRRGDTRIFYGRGTAAVTGHFLFPFSQVVLTEPLQDAQRVDHNSRIFFGRSTGVAAVGQPYFIWPQVRAREFEPEPERRVRQTDLHLYRTGYQTVGQPRFIWPPAKPDLTVEPDAVRGDHTRLHLYRVGYQTVGQPRFLWPNAKADQLVEPYELRIDRASRLFYGRSAAAAQIGQPFWIWPVAKAGQDVDPDAVRGDHSLLHRYRQSFQTVGQPWRTWPPQLKPDQSVEPDAARGDFTLLHRYRVGFQTVGQPNLYRFPTAKAGQDVDADAVRQDYTRLFYGRTSAPAVAPAGSEAWHTLQPVFIEFEEDARRTDHSARLFYGRSSAVVVASQPFWIWPQIKLPEFPVELERRGNQTLLNRYRFGFQTVGQPWAMRAQPIKPDQSVEPNPVRVDYSAQMFIGRTTFTAQPGQPWHTWRPAKPDLSMPPDAVRVEHNLRLFYGRTTAVAQIGQPFWIWPRQVADLSVESYDRRPDHTLLHLYRVGYQTVGQPWSRLFQPAKPDLSVDDYRKPPALDLTPFRSAAVAPSGSQAWNAFQPVFIEFEEDARRINHSLLLLYWRSPTVFVPFTPPSVSPAGRRVLVSELPRRVIPRQEQRRSHVAAPGPRNIVAQREFRLIIVQAERRHVNMAPTIRTFYQDPDENLDYEFHFEDALEASETIVTKSIVQDPGGLTVSALTESNGVVRCFLSGGSLNRVYTVTCRVTTSVTPRSYDRSMYLRIQHK